MTASICLFLAVLFVLWELWLYISEARRKKPGSNLRVRSVPRCPVCGRLSPYGICPNGHAGTSWVDEPYRDDRVDPFANDSDPFQR